ncbi:hypothetical protein GNI_115170 [Gregarina niphandrodes]|uniref:Uncharacterized protein n=1 Tax=Gregarina niphandrodes TaxID=110365 RepID=A0A023B344_GRENI|nr:hypothetical protein GNI_115170 [Gregarina niphandrodes]EZG55288.1 hypothetical protein GNI_115170 [Gregarina niphandrodes]|eukprot:XP_011131667.1 hypothetical protein GNI_115170 [Gregarina niphandrodes]
MHQEAKEGARGEQKPEKKEVDLRDPAAVESLTASQKAEKAKSAALQASLDAGAPEKFEFEVSGSAPEKYEHAKELKMRSVDSKEPLNTAMKPSKGRGELGRERSVTERHSVSARSDQQVDKQSKPTDETPSDEQGNTTKQQSRRRRRLTINMGIPADEQSNEN